MSFRDPQTWSILMFTWWHLLFDYFQFALIHGPNIPGFYALLLSQHWTLLAPCWTDCEEIPHACCLVLEGSCNALEGLGADILRLLLSTGSSYAVLEWLWGDTPRPRTEKPQEDSRHLSAGYMALEQRLHTTGGTLRRYPTSKGKGEAPARW